jgi:hypothetical protein
VRTFGLVLAYGGMVGAMLFVTAWLRVRLPVYHDLATMCLGVGIMGVFLYLVGAVGEVL